MKFTNSKPHNTHHFLAMACIMALFCAAALLFASHEPSRGLSADEALRRRLPQVWQEFPQGGRIVLNAQNNRPPIANYNGNMEVMDDRLFYDNLDERRHAQDIGQIYEAGQCHAPENFGVGAHLVQDKVEGQPENEDKTFITGRLDHWAFPFVGGVASIGVGFVWGYFVKTIDPSAGFGLGFGTTALVMFWWIYLLSRGGPNNFIINNFGSGFGANATVVVSSLCLLFGGLSISSLEFFKGIQAQNVSCVLGAVSIGCLVTIFLLYFLQPKEANSTTKKWWINVGVGAAGVFTTVGASIATCGVHAAETSDFQFLGFSMAIFGGAVLIVITTALFRNYKCTAEP